METFKPVLDLLGSDDAFREDVGVSRGLLAVWRHRNRVPTERFPDVAEAAERRGIPITMDDLFRAQRSLRGAAA